MARLEIASKQNFADMPNHENKSIVNTKNLVI